MKDRYCLDNKGNIAVMTALSLIVLVGMLALVVDGGYFFTTKNKWQNGVEAACLAGAAHLCDEDYESVVRQVAADNGLPSTSGEGLTVSRGFYDVDDEYGDFPTYKNFVSENADDFPEEEYGNAVLVSLESDIAGFFSGLFGRGKVRVKVEAVVYLKPLGVASLNEDSEIQIGPNSILKNGVLHSNGDIKFPKADWEGQVGWLTKTYKKPQFINIDLRAYGSVLECTECETSNGACNMSGMGNSLSGSPRIASISPCDDNYIESLRSTADIVYETGDAASDNVFWAWNGDQDNPCYAFDLTGVRDEREVIFFDAGGGTVLISEGSYCLGCGGGDCIFFDGHPNGEANGERIYNVTFITNGSITMDRHHWGATQIWGKEGVEQAVVITSGDIELTNNQIDGMVVRCGGTFGVHQHSSVGGGRIRIIADNDVFMTSCGWASGYGWSGTTDFKFGPPCPFPAGVYFGVLKSIDG